jgi:hypothetical protein
MGKQRKKRVRRRRRRARGWQRRAAARTEASGLVADYAAAVGLDPGSREAAILARLVGCSATMGYHSSNWISPALDGLSASGLPPGWAPLDVLDALERLQRWAYRDGRLAAIDVGCQLLNIELLRRRLGAPGRLVEPPALRSDEAIDERELRRALTQWEALSLGAFAASHGGDGPSGMMLHTAAGLLVEHLAETDGLPARWDRLDPAAFAVALPSLLGPELPSPPPGFLPALLDAAAFVVEVLGPRTDLTPEAVATKSRELSALAVAYGGGVKAA